MDKTTYYAIAICEASLHLNTGKIEYAILSALYFALAVAKS